MKKFKSLIAFPLILAVVVAALPFAVNASVGFTDVSESDWFYDDVTTLASLGVIDGYGDGSFKPHGIITYAEFTKLLVTSLDIVTPPETVDDGIHWAQHYIDAAKTKLIIPIGDIASGAFSPDKPITRAYMTMMMVKALGIDTSVELESPFVDANDIYATAAYNEYLLRGYQTENGREYRPSATATRAECAAIIYRVMSYYSDSAAYRSIAILDNVSSNMLSTEYEFIDYFVLMNRTFSTEFSFNSKVAVETIADYYDLASNLFPEYMVASRYTYTYSLDSTLIKYELTYDLDVSEFERMSDHATSKAFEVVAEIITDGMSDGDKVKAIHDYLVLNCRYDYDRYTSNSLPRESYLAYGTLVNGISVCQGYCAAFNLLCSYAGLRSVTVVGGAHGESSGHAWNLVLVDGEFRYVDVTFDDPVPDADGRVNYTYYLLDADSLKALGHNWDRSVEDLKYFY